MHGLLRRVAPVLLALAVGAPAQAQFVARSTTTKVPGVTTATGSGGFQGADDCNSPLTPLPDGPSSGNPFTTGTTGTTGQNEANCYAFGLLGIDNDVWFVWNDTTAGTMKDVVVTTCNGTGVDTKIAVYEQAAGCPAGGASIACNDDACGLQSTVVFTASSPSTYVIQLGTFPGASGGSGTFDLLTLRPPPCGTADDGTTENAFGLTAGGEMGWMQYFDCLPALDTVSTAYGTAMFPGSVTNGANSKIAVYTDTDLDPTNGVSLRASLSTTVVNGDTDILNKLPLGSVVSSGPIKLILATADHVAGQFPGPMDQTLPVANAWVVGSTLGPGTLETNNLQNNNVPPMNMAATGFPANWLLRAEDTRDCEFDGVTTVCFGDGSGAPCGCGNESDPSTGGCHNSVSGTMGAQLDITGFLSLSNLDAHITIQRVRTQPGLLFQGNNTIGGGVGITFGDGIRCCGQNVIRLTLLDPPPGPEPVDIEFDFVTVPPGIEPGDKRCYQYWYRDPGGTCGSNFNLTNAVDITWNLTSGGGGPCPTITGISDNVPCVTVTVDGADFTPDLGRICLPGFFPTAVDPTGIDAIRSKGPMGTFNLTMANGDAGVGWGAGRTPHPTVTGLDLTGGLGATIEVWNLTAIQTFDITVTSCGPPPGMLLSTGIVNGKIAIDFGTLTFTGGERIETELHFDTDVGTHCDYFFNEAVVEFPGGNAATVAALVGQQITMAIAGLGGQCADIEYAVTTTDTLLVGFPLSTGVDITNFSGHLHVE